MRKEYLPRPSEVPGTSNPRRILSTTPLEIDLNRSSDRFRCLQLQEPDLVFGGGHRCVDPKTGLAAHGPYGVTCSEDARQIRVGIVGTPQAIENTIKLLKELSQPIEQTASIDCVLHPSFPGINSQEPIRVHLVTQSQWHRPLYKRDFRATKECGNSGTRRWLLQEMFAGEVRAISELENPPQVVLCAISEFMTRLLGSETAGDAAGPASNDKVLQGAGEGISHRLIRKFQGGFKAECMGSLPTELIWDQASSRTRGTQDRATLAWNLSLRLMHKARVIPWRLAGASKDSCFVGISFCRSSQKASSITLRSFALVITELGDRFIVEGEEFACQQCKQEEHEPHLDKAHARNLLSRALSVFEKEVGVSPRTAVVHKSAPYSEAEREGFESALSNISEYGLVTITRRGIFCVRPGLKPILRGTAIPFDDKMGLVFTSGYVPFLRGYHGSRIPQPLEITENWGSITFQQAAQDLIRLTKLDLNSPDLCADSPVTLAKCEEIGGILEVLGQKETSTDDRYYL
jgi:hypothetical protein